MKYPGKRSQVQDALFKVPLIVSIYKLAAQFFYYRVPNYLTVSDFIEFVSGLVNQ
jgi:hypothetical protein